MKIKFLSAIIIISGILLSVIKYNGFEIWSLPLKTLGVIVTVSVILFLDSVLIYNRLISLNSNKVALNATSNNDVILYSRKSFQKKIIYVTSIIILISVLIIYKIVNQENHQGQEPKKSNVTSVPSKNIGKRKDSLQVHKHFPEILRFETNFKKDPNYGNELNVNVDLKSTHQDVLENASMLTSIEITYRSKSYTLMPDYEKSITPKEFTNLSLGMPKFDDYNNTRVFNSVDAVPYFKGLYDNELDFQIDLSDVYFNNNYSNREQIRDIWLEIDKEFDGVWYPQQIKKIRFSYDVDEMIGRDKLPSIEYFKASVVIMKNYIEVNNSIGYDSSILIKETDITNIWNEYYYKSL